MDVVIASANKNKVKEFREILKNSFDNIYSLSDLNISGQAEETGCSFTENAVLKAEFVKQFTDKAVIADDSGLCVDTLNGAPGVFSARYAGIGAGDKANREKLLAELGGAKNRRAKFVCALCLIYPDGRKLTAEGETFGEITDSSYEKIGNNGFGYDKLFYSYDLNTTFGLADAKMKNAVSHRQRAFDALLEKMTKINI